MKSSPRSRFLSCAGRRIHFLEWGSPDKDPVIIWHGVAGTAWDHHELAAILSTYYHVICPDSIGCGLSQWPGNIVQELRMAFQQRLVKDLVSQLGITSLRWIGASRGGALGMRVASEAEDFTVSHLVLNDAGPLLPLRFRQALAKNLGASPLFVTLKEFERHLRSSLSRDGLLLCKEQWRWLANFWSRRMPDGQYTYHHAPTLMNQVLQPSQDFDLWESYDRITSPTLLIHGIESQVLPREQVIAMQSRGPKCQLLTRQGGHISFFHTIEEQDAVLTFLCDR